MIDQNESRRDRYRKWFHIVDANGDHFIDEQDFVLTFERVAHFRGPTANREILVAAARARYAEIAKADLAGDGRVTEEEYLAAALAQEDPGPVLSGMHEAMARGGFASFDIDGDGVVNLSDFVLAHAAFGLDPRLQAAIERFHYWDTNQDGRITLDEWLPSYRRHQLTDEMMPFFFCVD